jgi:oligo-1,6-glucosidase
MSTAQSRSPKSQKTWWKEAVVYQIYPRSFKDSNGDGVGDLRGILSKLDYIQSLGVDAVWLNPIYKSPNDDGGYDISDYFSIQPEFGTLQDFDELLTGLHHRGIKLIMDLVVNHTSDEHPWFVESRKSKDNSFRDYYFWRKEPNNWPSFFGGSAWQRDDVTGEYYLHLFSKKQPDLNWENPKVRDEVNRLMKFWLKRGVDGLRLDVISAISKRTDFPNTDTTDFNETIRKYYSNGPRLKEFIAEMRSKVWDQFDMMTVGEGPGITSLNAVDYLDENHGMNMIFHFGHMFLDQGKGGRFDPIPWSLSDFKKIFQLWDETLANKGWGSVFLGNHDFARIISRWGDDGEHREASSKLLLTLLLSMRGTPFIFQGDEIGMTNIQLRSINESRDVETITGWKEVQKRGVSEEEFLKLANYSGRDHARTPMQWNDSIHAGFSEATPWMTVNPNKEHIHVSAQQVDQNSILSYFKRMRGIRKLNPVLVYGSYEPVEFGNEKLFAFYRILNKEKFLIVLNFSSENINLSSDTLPDLNRRVIGNYTQTDRSSIQPWEANLFKL